MDYYLAMKRNEVMIHATMWMDLKNDAKWKKITGHILYNYIYMEYTE